MSARSLGRPPSMAAALKERTASINGTLPPIGYRRGFVYIDSVLSQEVWCWAGPWLGLTMWEIMHSKILYWGHTLAGNRDQGESQGYALMPTKPDLLRTHPSNISSLEACNRRCQTFVPMLISIHAAQEVPSLKDKAVPLFVLLSCVCPLRIFFL
jgi:hypothetical protein